MLLDECAAVYTRGWMETGNIASYAERGMLPNAGTVLDQPAWFIDFWQILQSNINRIEIERMKRK